MIRLIGRDFFKGVFALFLLGPSAIAHQGHHHHPSAGQSDRPSESNASIQKVRQSYLKVIKPLFQSKCMDGHSNQTQYPWYHEIPVVKRWIDEDIAEARSHLDFSNDFPFVSHATVQEDLEAIKNTVLEGSMPPLSYRLFHPGSALSDAERKKVKEWVDESLKLVGKKEKGERS